MTNDGERFLDYIPKEVIQSTNSQEMKIRFINDSLLQIVGSDNYDSLMGTNCQMAIFSEYALQDPRAYQYIRPILTANNGTAIFLSTPRGKNHLWELYQIALNLPDWFVYKLTVEDTNHIPLSLIEKEKQEGVMSEDLIQQEYFTSFTMGVEGSYYAKYLDRMRVKGQISQVPWECGFKVHTAWDLGVRDSTTIIFFQVIGQTVRLIDCYSNAKEGLEHYVNVIQSKEYSYGKHIAPHDIAVQEFGSGMTRIEKAKQLGIKFTIAENVSIMDGIESVRSALSKIWIDEVKCGPLLKALENYRQEYDSKKKVYKSQPLHNYASHFCFTGDTKILTRNGMREIMLIDEESEVLTLEGWRKCSKAQLTKKDAQVVEVTFNDNTKVRCTPDHLFLTVSGWKSAENLEKGLEIQSSLMNCANTFVETFTESTQTKDILPKVCLTYIEMFGKMLLGMRQKMSIYITKIATYITTIFGTWNALMGASILEKQDLMQRAYHKKLVIQQMNGIDLILEESGIDDKQLEAHHGLNGKESQGIAWNAKRNTRRLFVGKDVNKNFVIPIAKQLIIENVEFLQEKQDVYDITVPGIHHYSLSNGAIVHNSDAMRYLCVSLPKTRDGLTPEELDKRYMDAVYGNNSTMPAVFRDDLPQSGPGFF